MPRGRFANRDRSTNAQYWSLDCEHRNFWDLLFPWCDAEGRQNGNPAIIKGLVCPIPDEWPIEKVEAMLNKLESIKRHDGLGWVVRYHKDGKHVLWLPGFDENQPGLRKDKEAKGRYGYSDYPPPPSKLLAKARKVIVGAKSEEQPEAKITTDDLKVAAMIKYYEEEMGSTLTPADYDKLVAFADAYPDGWFERAVIEAKNANAKSPLRYIEKVLESWHTKDAPPETSTDSQGFKEI